MPVEDSKRWNAASAAAVAIWLFFVLRLMIADVWDETNGMLFFSSAAMPLSEKLRFVATQSLGFWRPLPTFLVAIVLHAVTDFDVSWRVLRGINMAMLLAALALFLGAIRRWDGLPPLRRFLFVVAFLFSGSAVITAGWYANIFDAAALLLVACATWLLSRDRAIEAGLVIGTAFFCKETAALALPFLVVLLAAGRLSLRQALRAGIPATILGALYFVVRSRIVPFGSTADIHGFDPAQIVPTLLHLGESFWRQTLKGDGPGVIGYVFTIASLAVLRRPRLIAAATAFLAGVAVVYWGMFGEYQADVLMHHLNFVGRLFLVPTALLLFVMLLERRIAIVALLCLPIVFGGITTWRDHARFQRTYRRIYRTAAEATRKPLVVHYPAKPLEDTVRGIRVGDFPDAPVKIDPTTSRLTFR